METRMLGTTGLTVSALGLGCGAVGGLMVRGTPADQDRAIGIALDGGITFFDTAPLYGDGASETNLGRALARAPGAADVVVATKVRLAGRVPIAAVVEASLDASLRRLGRERVDLLQLHDPIGGDGDGAVSARTVVDAVVPAFERLRAAGKLGSFGITAVGDRGAVETVIDSRQLHTAQVPFNILNPSAAVPVPPDFPYEDLGQRLVRATAAGMGTIVIRALAGGALSGTTARHPVSMAVVDPMATGDDYPADVAAAQRLEPLVADGWARSLTEAALRFVLHAPAVSTALVGVATVEQLEAALAAAAAGPLPPEALEMILAVASAG